MSSENEENEFSSEDLPPTCQTVRPDVERELLAACRAKDRRSLARLILLGWREGGREAYRLPWIIPILPILMFAVTFVLYLLGGATFAWAGFLIVALLASVLILPRNLRRAFQVKRELEKLELEAHLADQSETKNGCQSDNGPPVKT